jgi:hypothetical protein
MAKGARRALAEACSFMHPINEFGHKISITQTDRKTTDTCDTMALICLPDVD